MLFYLIIAIIIGLFIYVTYNLIIKTCGCIKEGFTTQTHTDIFEKADVSFNIFDSQSYKTDIKDICNNPINDAFCNNPLFQTGMNNDIFYKNENLDCSGETGGINIFHDVSENSDWVSSDDISVCFNYIETLGAGSDIKNANYFRWDTSNNKCYYSSFDTNTNFENSQCRYDASFVMYNKVFDSDQEYKNYEIYNIINQHRKYVKDVLYYVKTPASDRTTQLDSQLNDLFSDLSDCIISSGNIIHGPAVISKLEELRNNAHDFKGKYILSETVKETDTSITFNTYYNNFLNDFISYSFYTLQYVYNYSNDAFFDGGSPGELEESREIMENKKTTYNASKNELENYLEGNDTSYSSAFLEPAKKLWDYLFINTKEINTDCERRALNGGENVLFTKDFRVDEGREYNPDSDDDYDYNQGVQGSRNKNTGSYTYNNMGYYRAADQFKDINSGGEDTTDIHRFIKNVLKNYLDVLSLKNLDLKKINNDSAFEMQDISMNYANLKIEEGNYIVWPSDTTNTMGKTQGITNTTIANFIRANPNTGVLNLYNDTFQPDLSYNDIFKQPTIKELHGEWNLIGCNLWEKIITEEQKEDDIYYKQFYLKIHTNRNIYICYKYNSDYIHLFQVNTNKLKVIKKPLNERDPNGISSYRRINGDKNCYNEYRDINISETSDCSKNISIEKNTFQGFFGELFLPKTDPWHDLDGEADQEKCNNYCFLNREHVYVTGGASGYKFITKNAWQTDTFKNPNSSATWCSDNCPIGLIKDEEINGAYTNIPGGGTGANEGNTAYWAKKFGCPITGTTSQAANTVPAELIDSYNFYTGTDNNVGSPAISEQGLFDGVDKCREGATNYASAIGSQIASDKVNEIVGYYNHLRTTSGFMGTCDTDCNDTKTVFHNGVPYKVKIPTSCNGTFDTAQCDFNPEPPSSSYTSAKQYKCRYCPPEMDNALLTFLTESEDPNNESNYSSSDTVASTLENPEEACSENGDWLQRLKDRAKTEYYLDDSERIRQIGQEYLTQLCSCMGYKSTCAVSLLEAETIGKYFVQFAKGETSMAGLSEITSEIIKSNKFDLFSDMFGEGEINSYDAIWDLDLSKVS